MDGGAWWVKIAGQPLATQLPPPHRGSREPVLLTSYREYRTLSNFFNTLASDHLHNCHHHHRHHHQYPLEDSLTELMAGHHTLLSSRGKQKEVPPGMFRWPICPRVPRLSVLISWTHSKHPRALRRISSGCQATGLHSADPARSWIPSPLFLVLWRSALPKAGDHCHLDESLVTVSRSEDRSLHAVESEGCSLHAELASERLPALQGRVDYLVPLPLDFLTTLLTLHPLFIRSKEAFPGCKPSKDSPLRYSLIQDPASGIQKPDLCVHSLTAWHTGFCQMKDRLWPVSASRSCANPT